MILIIGCGRSGTRYISKVLNLGGLKIGHERVGKDGMSCWLATVGDDIRVERPWGSVNFVDDFPEPPKKIIHQIRHPLNVISSFQVASKYAWRFISQYINFETDDLTYRCMKYWYQWNLMAEKWSTWRYRVEQLDTVFKKFCYAIGEPHLFKVKDKMLIVGKSDHTKKSRYTPLSWDDLFRTDEKLTYQIKDMALRYGYPRKELGMN